MLKTGQGALDLRNTGTNLFTNGVALNEGSILINDMEQIRTGSGAYITGSGTLDIRSAGTVTLPDSLAGFGGTIALTDTRLRPDATGQTVLGTATLRLGSGSELSVTENFSISKLHLAGGTLTVQVDGDASPHSLRQRDTKTCTKALYFPNRTTCMRTSTAVLY